MTQNPPVEYTSDDTSSTVLPCRDLLAKTRSAVIAMSSGGCARYAFSMNVDYCLDRMGYPLIHYSSDNAHHHLIVTNSTMEFRIPFEVTEDGLELSILILTGMLTLVDPGDHDNIDRYSRYFDVEIENYSSGKERLYRFAAKHACLELVSGKRLTIPLIELIVRNRWTPGEEGSLITAGNKMLNLKPECKGKLRFAGFDGQGADIVHNEVIKRLVYSFPMNDVNAAKQELAALLDRNPLFNP